MSLTPDQLRNEAAAIGVSMAGVAAQAGVQGSMLSAFLAGRQQLNGHEHKVEKALTQLRNLKESTNIPVDFANSAAVRAAIERLEEQQGRAVAVTKKQLRDLGLGTKDGFAVDKIAVLQFRHPLSQYTIEKVLQGQGSDEQVQVLADLVAQLKHLNDIYAQSGGLDFEHEDLREVRWQLARMYQSDPAPSQKFMLGVR